MTNTKSSRFRLDSLNRSEAFDDLVAALHDVTATVGVPAQVKRILVHVTRALAATSGFAVGVHGDQVHLVEHVDLHAAGVAHFPATVTGRSPIGECLASRTPIWIGDATERDRWYPQLFGAPRSLQAAALVPVDRADATIGVVCFAFDHARSFTEPERRYCAAVADLTAVVLNTAPAP